jgi:hypothetical protein
MGGLPGEGKKIKTGSVVKDTCGVATKGIPRTILGKALFNHVSSSLI